MTPDSPLVTDKGFNDSILKAFRYFWKIKKFNDIDWIVLALLDLKKKKEKEKNGLRDIISRSSYGAKIVKNQEQGLITS